MSKSKIKKRLSNFELLRIISIIMIIAHHYSLHGNWSNRINGIFTNNILLDFLAIGGKIGVISFVLISGYFGIESKFKIKKLIKLVVQVLFYSVLFLMIFSIKGFSEIEYNLKVILKSVFPITFSLYWFITAYIVIYILSPFLNKLIKSLTQNELEKIILILLILCYIIPTFTTSDLNLGNHTIFVFLYILGGYIKIYFNDFKFKHNAWIYFFIIYILILLSQLILEILSCKYAILGGYINYFTGLNKLPILLCSIILFIIFKNLKIESKLIDKIASASFGIYLIHDNYFVRTFLWQLLLKNNTYYFSNYLWIHAIISIVLVYIIALLIELARASIVDKYVLQFIYRTYDKIIQKVKQITEKSRFSFLSKKEGV